jgi:hypothetical protein
MNRSTTQVATTAGPIDNVPGRTGVNMLPETVGKLSEIENIVAIKEASGSISQMAEVKLRAGDRIIASNTADGSSDPLEQAAPAADGGAGRWLTRTNFVYTETRADEQLMFAATAWHTLVTVDGALRIRLKRVNLLNCDAALPSIQLFM